MSKQSARKRGLRTGRVVLLKGGLEGVRAEGKVWMMTLPVGKLKAAAYNPRVDLRPGDVEWEKLVRSIEEFGYVDPLVWNKKTGNLVGGHQRLKVLVARGAKHVDVSVVDLTPAKEKALNVALNHVKGAWEDAALATLLAELRADKSIDATLTGFSAEEIGRIVEEEERLVEMLVPRGEGEGTEAQRHEGTEGGEGKKSIAEVWQVVVECKGEREQKRLFERMSKEGLKCKLMTM